MDSNPRKLSPGTREKVKVKGDATDVPDLKIKFSGLVLQVSKFITSKCLNYLSEPSKTTILQVHEQFPGDEYETSLYRFVPPSK